jgi:hypothetical protein
MLGSLRLDDPLKRDALRVNGVVPPRHPTLFGRRAFRRPGGCDLDAFDIIGFSNHSVEVLENDPDLARHPLHHFPLMPPTYEGPTIVHVTLAITAAIPTQADWLGIYAWQANHPRRPYQGVFQGFDPLGKDRGAQRQIRNAIAWLADSKKESGRHADDRTVVCTVFEESLDRAIPKVRDAQWRDEGVGGRPLRQDDLAKALNMTVRTLQIHMNKCTIDWGETRLRQR